MSATAQETTLTRVNHVVIAVESLQTAATDWERCLGVTGRNYFEGSPLRMKRLQFDVGDAYFALCQPIDEQSVFHNFLQTRGEGVYAIGFDVAGYADVIARIRDAGGSVSGGDRSAWVHPRHTHGLNLGLHPDGSEHPPTEPTIFKAFRHIVIAVHDRDRAARDWERYLGLAGKNYVDVTEQGMRSVQFDVGSCDLDITLAEPLGEHSPLREFLQAHPEGVRSIAVKVDDVAGTARGMQERGAVILGDIANDPQIFVHPKTTHGLLLGLA
jgi:methylmalonyl-CoA/ethylmalonyl-CoA epimerase